MNGMRPGDDVNPYATRPVEGPLLAEAVDLSPALTILLAPVLPILKASVVVALLGLAYYLVCMVFYLRAAHAWYVAGESLFPYVITIGQLAVIAALHAYGSYLAWYYWLRVRALLRGQESWSAFAAAHTWFWKARLVCGIAGLFVMVAVFVLAVLLGTA
jgi:hypothetical protein